MKKALVVLSLSAFIALPSFAKYIVVLKSGTQYIAKSKWTVVNGKAIVTLENGQTLQLDPSLIDAAKSEQATKIGMANTNVIDLNPNTAPKPAAQQQQPSLGSQIRLRRVPAQPAVEESTAPKQTSAPAPVTASPGAMSQQVLDKFELAMENIGIFDRKITSNGANTIRAELNGVDTEERVFNAISASSFLMVRNANVDGARIDMVEIFIKTSIGGAGGRFQMTRADAEAINNKTISQQEYFVRKVIY